MLAELARQRPWAERPGNTARLMGLSRNARPNTRLAEARDTPERGATRKEGPGS